MNNASTEYVHICTNELLDRDRVAVVRMPVGDENEPRVAAAFNRHERALQCAPPDGGIDERVDVETRFAEALWGNEAILERVLASNPMGRIGVPDEVAGVVAFLSTVALMRWFRQTEVRAFDPFALYCVLAGAGSLAWLLLR